MLHFGAGDSISNMNLVQENNTLLNSLPASTGDMARLANRLSETTNRLEEIINQAEAQFKVGDRHATFSKETIRALSKGLMED